MNSKNKMKRRKFIEILPSVGLGLSIFPSTACNLMTTKAFKGTKQVTLKIENQNPINILEGKSVAFNWTTTGLAPKHSILVKPVEDLPEANIFLRVTLAQETFDKKVLNVTIPEKNTNLGAIDIRSSSVLVPYELEISQVHVREINRFGLELKLEAAEPLWIFDKKSPDFDNSSLIPHLLVSTEKHGSIQNFMDRFMSVNSIQAFGWREGTVLDGLWQLYSKKGEEKALQTIKQHLGLFFDDNKNLVYETAHSIRKINELDGIESTMPFATIARVDPNHPILTKVVEAWDSYTMKNGMVTGGRTRTAEGCYTVAYPMAVIGKLWKNKGMMQNAMEQLQHRFVLIDEDNFYLRYTDGKTTYMNWARGAAWTLLGFARTISELKDEIKDDAIIDKFREGVDIAVSMQQSNGLWNCFMHENVLPDTSGSAGISAAIMTGIDEGILDKSYRQVAEKCWNGLQNYITPDGFLKGVAQDNRGGVELQQSDYRVIAQMGMGLMAQLYAFLK